MHLAIFCGYTPRFVSDLVGNPEDRFSNSAAHLLLMSVSLLSSSFVCAHCENTPMQYTAIFHGCKNDTFQVTKCDIFLIFAQNID